MLTIEVKKALAINCWDVFVNGTRYDRFDKKYEARGCAEDIATRMGIRHENIILH